MRVSFQFEATVCLELLEASGPVFTSTIFVGRLIPAMCVCVCVRARQVPARVMCSCAHIYTLFKIMCVHAGVCHVCMCMFAPVAQRGQRTIVVSLISEVGTERILL